MIVWNKAISFSCILTQKVTESLKVVNSIILFANMSNVCIKRYLFINPVTNTVLYISSGFCCDYPWWILREYVTRVKPFGWKIITVLLPSELALVSICASPRLVHVGLVWIFAYSIVTSANYTIGWRCDS